MEPYIAIENAQETYLEKNKMATSGNRIVPSFGVTNFLLE